MVRLIPKHTRTHNKRAHLPASPPVPPVRVRDTYVLDGGGGVVVKADPVAVGGDPWEMIIPLCQPASNIGIGSTSCTTRNRFVLDVISAK